MDEPVITPSAPPPVTRRDLIISLIFNGLLVVLAGGLALYAFMLNFDLGDVKRRLSKEVEAHQQTTRYLTEARNQVIHSQREIEQLKAQLSYKETDYLTATSGKPALPVVIGFRESFLGKGLVAKLENTSDRYLTLQLSVRNPTLSDARRFKLDIQPHADISFGHLEGWQFASGDEITVYHDDFAVARLTVP
ncbi:MAG: hypothetical protein ABL877_07340 [Thiobacillus sp.]